MQVNPPVVVGPQVLESYWMVPECVQEFEGGEAAKVQPESVKNKDELTPAAVSSLYFLAGELGLTNSLNPQSEAVPPLIRHSIPVQLTGVPQQASQPAAVNVVEADDIRY